MYQDSCYQQVESEEETTAHYKGKGGNYVIISWNQETKAGRMKKAE